MKQNVTATGATHVWETPMAHTMTWDRLRRLGWVAGLWLVLLAGPAWAQTGALTDLSVPNLSPAFDPMVTQYSIPRTSSCVVTVSATLANPLHRMYIASGETASGVSRSAWVCNGTTKIAIVIYQNWTEVGRYTVNVVDMPPPPPPVVVPVAYLTSLSVPNLSPAFDPFTADYTVPRTSACSVAVSATLADPSHKLYIASNQVASGATANAWVCNGKTKIDVVVFQVWAEKARYTITLVDGPEPEAPPVMPNPVPPPTPTPMPALTEPVPDPSPIPPLSTATLPLPAPTNAFTAERLLHQATFGPTQAEFVAVKAKGVDRWLAEQFQIPAGGIADDIDVNELRAAMFLKLANGQDQLRQRMAFALGQLLVVSTNKLVNGYEAIPWVRLLENHAFGNYRSLLRDMTISPTMGKYLDLANSDGSPGHAPNENYPREVMQLFSIGLYELNMDGTYKTDALGQKIPTYTQATIKEVARALSGWTYPTQPGMSPTNRNQEYYVGLMEPRPTKHDFGAKTLPNGVVLPAGQTVTQDMESVVDALFEHPNTAPFVATRLIRALVTSNPTAAYIERIATVFADNGQGVRGDLQAVLVAILTDPDASLPSINDGRLRDPLQHVIGLSRALGITVTDPNQFMYILSRLGEKVLTPATVFSFYSPLSPLPGDPTKFGPEFQIYTPALSIQRANFVYSILSGNFMSSFAMDLAPYQALAGDAYALVEQVNQTLLFGRMSPELRAVLVAAAQGTTDLKQRALGTLYLTAISSEFLVLTSNFFLPN